MRLHYVLIIVLAFFCKTVFATHAFPLVNYTFTTGPSGVTVSGASNGATCGGGPYWMQIEVSCSPTGFGGVQPACLINTLTNWTGPGVTYVSYPFFNSLLNIPGYNAASGWADQCVQEPYNNILIPYSYFCPGTTMYFRAREAVYGTTSTGPWTAVNSFVVPGVPPVACSASLTHSPFTTTLTPSCPGAKTLTILNPNCPLPCASPSLAPSCITSTVYYKYYANPGGIQAITVNPTLALPSVTATTTFSVFRIDSCSSGACPPQSSCGFPGGGWPQMTTIFVSTPTVVASASPATICPATSSTLTATGGVTYTWQPGNLTGATVVVSPGTTTLYTVTATNSINCIASTTLQLTVSSAPVISISTSTNVLCAGSPATLTAGGATNYTWSTGANGSLTVVNPTITTTYTVVGSNGSCTGSNTLNISVLASPTVAAFSTTNTICAGSNLNLFAGGALTYTWQPGNLTGAIVNVSPAATTIYTVTGTLLSCTDTETLQINVSNGPTITVAGSPTTICSASGGSATLSATGALSYTWNPGAIIASSIVITPTITTTYSVSGINALGCISTTTVSYSVTPTPTLNTILSSTAICAGSSATLTGSGATTYTWNPGAITGGTATVTPASTTTYTLIGANGICISTKTIALVVNANPTVVANANPTVICSGNSSTLTANGALTYTWNPGALSGGTITVTPVSTTNYTVTGSNAAGCTHSVVRQVSVNITPTLNPVSSPTSVCVGGSATLSTGGALSYTWNPGALTGGTIVISPTVTTIYTVTGVTANCSDTKTISLLVNPIPTVNVIVSPTVICSGATATLTGSGALTYTWNPGNISGNPVTVTPTATTLYTVTGSNGSCTSTKTISLLVNPNPTITAVASPTTICVGSSATLSSSGALSYTWNPGAVTGGTITVNPLTTTLYTVTGANGFGCTTTRTVNLIVTPIPTITPASSLATICVGNSTTLTATGATNYTWNPGALTGSNVTVSPVINTTYTVTGSSGACSSTATIVITVNPNPTITAVVSPTTICAGSSATLSSSGAASYTWNPGALNSGTVTVNPTATTLYTVTGANAFGCTATRTLNLIVTPVPTINVTASPTAICIGNASTLTATGATNYTWNPGALTGSNISVTPTITTTYTIFGSNGSCSNTKTITIIVNPLPTLTVVATPTIICSGASATLTASGASAYNWLPGVLSGSAIAVTPTITTTYTVIGTSTTGCSNTKTITLIVNPIPSLTVSAASVSVCSGNSTTLIGTATGGGPFAAVWNPGAVAGNTTVVSPTVTTTYTWSVSNSFACYNTATLTINVTPTPTLITSASSATICAGASTTLNASGASTYTWNPGAAVGGTIIVTPAITTTYTVSGANGSCVSTKTINITVNPNPTITAVASPTNICAGGSATLSSSGATSYTWNPGAVNGGTITVAPATTTLYTVTAANGFGCTATRTVNLIVTPNPTLTATASPTANCAGATVTLSATGAASYSWNPGAIIGGTIAVNPTITTTYTVFGNNGICSNTQTVTVIVNPLPTLTVAATPTAICIGNSATLTVSGASAYNWLPGALSGSAIVVSPTVATTYTVIGTSSFGCTRTTTITVGINPTPTVTAIASSTTMCAGGSVTLSSSGASTYTWYPGAIIGGTITVTPSVTTTYSVAATNGFGCGAATLITVSVTATPTLIIAVPLVPVCIGNNATLTAMGATNYTWLPGVSNATVLVTPLTATTIFTLIGSNGLCQSTQTVGLVPSANPTITVTASPTTICPGNSATLTASGTTSYSWNTTATGSTTIVSPTTSSTYTVVGTDFNGCSGQSTVNVNVSPVPSLTATASATSICIGTTVTLTANGSGTYTWNPTGLTTATITDTPALTTTYTVSGNNAFGCTGTSTVIVVVNSVPSLTLAPLSATICSGYATTLTALGATNYTWLPSGNTTSITIETPTVNTTYTVTGANGVCSSSATATIFVTPLPANLTATTSGSITCTAQTVSLTGSSTSTNVSYLWNGPSSYTSIVQNPTVNVQGTYTFNVIDNVTGCIASVTLSVPTDSTIPSVTTTVSGTITCSNNSVTINANSTSANVSYSWTGPGSFTSTTQTFTSMLSGVYTVTVTDLNSTCSTTAIAAVAIQTNVAATVSITPATCTGSISNNDGTITLLNFTGTDKYDFVAGSTYTGTATYLTAANIPTTGIITNTLANPTGTVAYTVRIFDANGCIKDTTLILIPINCLSVNSLGIAKAVSATTLNVDGSYDVNYKVVVKNYGLLPLTSVMLTENLNTTFPLPATFTVTSIPVITSAGSSLSINPAFDGNLQTSLTNILTSTLNVGQSDTIVFGVKVIPNGFFGPFNNSVIGLASPSPSVFVADSSNVGLDPDPDANLDPTNNDIPTPIQFAPHLFFGITKSGTVSTKLSDKTYDITYTITIHNLGHDTLKNITAKDSLFNNTIRYPATYTMKYGPVVNGNLNANALYNGNTDINLLAGSNKIAPGSVNTIIFTINVNPDTVTIYKNSAYGNALSSTSVTVSDTSNAGNDPDSNGNGIWNEPADNVPTILIIPKSDFFIPDGFTPNGDGKNDLFVIKGLPGDIENVFTVYNRWGNKVYTKDNYDNTWNGTANVNGTLGTEKLPAGTYYYILEFKGGDIKTTNGFIVIQY